MCSIFAQQHPLSLLRGVKNSFNNIKNKTPSPTNILLMVVNIFKRKCIKVNSDRLPIISLIVGHDKGKQYKGNNTTTED